MNRRVFHVACLLLLGQLACGSKPLDPSSGAGGSGGTTGGGGYRPDGPPFPPCSGDPNADCINGCATGHVLSARICQDGTWVCPFGTNPTAECAGTGDCPPGGGSAPCTDGASAVRYNMMCSNGTWTCPAGTRPATAPVDAGAHDAGPDALTCGDGGVACADAGSD